MSGTQGAQGRACGRGSRGQSPKQRGRWQRGDSGSGRGDRSPCLVAPVGHWLTSGWVTAPGWAGRTEEATGGRRDTELTKAPPTRTGSGKGELGLWVQQPQQGSWVPGCRGISLSPFLRGFRRSRGACLPPCHPNTPLGSVPSTPARGTTLPTPAPPSPRLRLGGVTRPSSGHCAAHPAAPTMTVEPPEGPRRPVGSKHTPCPHLAELPPAQPLCAGQLAQPKPGSTPIGLPGPGRPRHIPLALFLYQKHLPCLFISFPILSFWSSHNLARASLDPASRSTHSKAKWVRSTAEATAHLERWPWGKLWLFAAEERCKKPTHTARWPLWGWLSSAEM